MLTSEPKCWGGLGESSRRKFWNLEDWQCYFHHLIFLFFPWNLGLSNPFSPPGSTIPDIYSVSDLGVSSNLIGSLSLRNWALFTPPMSAKCVIRDKTSLAWTRISKCQVNRLELFWMMIIQEVSMYLKGELKWVNLITVLSIHVLKTASFWKRWLHSIQRVIKDCSSSAHHFEYPI